MLVLGASGFLSATSAKLSRALDDLRRLGEADCEIHPDQELPPRNYSAGTLQ
jgi:hypothetical protein